MELEIALKAAMQFGAEAELNGLPSWSNDDRKDIAHYYGVEHWSNIPKEHRALLLTAYRKGEHRKRAQV